MTKQTVPLLTVAGGLSGSAAMAFAIWVWPWSSLALWPTWPVTLARLALNLLAG